VLQRLGVLLLPRLRKALAASTVKELGPPLKEVIGKIEAAGPSPPFLRLLRAVEALEHNATPEARRLLRALAGGEEDTEVADAARAALRRLPRE
jgi:hypothetical protein